MRKPPLVNTRTKKLPLALCAITAITTYAATATADGNHHIVLTDSKADYDKVKSEVVSKGGAILTEMPEINIMVIEATPQVKDELATSPRVSGITEDRSKRRTDGDDDDHSGGAHDQGSPPFMASHKRRPGFDPVFAEKELMWNFDRIDVADAWKKTQGSPSVTVGVLDTGIDYTHGDLAGKVAKVVDLSAKSVAMGNSPCGPVTDADKAAELGLDPKFVNLDFNGHGTGMAGILAAKLDGLGTNGIAPKVKLVAIKTGQWCGFDNDSDEILGIYLTPFLGIDVLSMSFGDILDVSDADQKTLYEGYVRAVNYAISHGTSIVSSAGNDHVRIDVNGQITSEAQQTRPGSNPRPLLGQFPVPSGIPGVIDVGATVNVVHGSSLTCDPSTIGDPTDTGSNATCKPSSEDHQPTGVGLKNQLAYYSNYGPRIDFVAPGGSRKFNLPHWDRGGTRGWPWTSADGYKAWGIFAPITNHVASDALNPLVALDFNSSDLTLGLTFPPGFAPNQNYSTTIGTSEATPHVAAVLALIASKHPELRRQPHELYERLKESARPLSGNTTPPNSPTDKSPGDRTGIPCTGNPARPTQVPGYCHLGGDPIPDSEAYGHGLIDAGKALN